MKLSLKNAEFDVMGLGEVMLRLSPPGKERLSQSETLEKRAGGAELNVVSGISQLGMRTGMMTKLPEGGIGSFVKHKIRYAGTSDDGIVYDSSPTARLGIYYYESGAYPRLPAVTYDRARSSFCSFRYREVPEALLDRIRILHVSGITLALDEGLRADVIELLHVLKERGTAISFDVNYRAKLWDEETARRVISQVLPLVDILFISEETLRRMFAQTGTLAEIHRSFAQLYPNLCCIASTQRTVISPTKHSFTSTVYDCAEDRQFTEAAYENIDVVDRIGSGDAYVAGALYGILQYGNVDDAARWGNAMSALKNTIPGDMTVCSEKEIRKIIEAHADSGETSEMAR